MQLPEGLDATYNRSLQYIDTLGEARRNRAYRILQWVTYARRPLTLSELVEAAAIDDMRENHWDHKHIVTDPKRLISDCAHLVVHEPPKAHWEKDKILLAHFSVVEFLTSWNVDLPYQILHPVDAGAMLAESVFKFLLILSASDWSDIYEIKQAHPLADYLGDWGCHWASHLHDMSHEDTVSGALKSFSPLSKFRQLLDTIEYVIILLPLH
jgi:hypothetical protein